MVVNTESVVGYNNKLKKATSFMRIGVNSDLNIPVRRSALKHNLGSRAVKLPHSGVETRVVKSDSEAGATAELEKAKLRTKEKQVPKRETSDIKSEARKAAGEVSDSDRESGDRESGVAAAGATAELEKAKLRTKTVSTSHETNLNVLIIVAGGLAWLLFR